MAYRRILKTMQVYSIYLHVESTLKHLISTAHLPYLCVWVCGKLGYMYTLWILICIARPYLSTSAGALCFCLSSVCTYRTGNILKCRGTIISWLHVHFIQEAHDLGHMLHHLVLMHLTYKAKLVSDSYIQRGLHSLVSFLTGLKMLLYSWWDWW